ncbi:peptidoglycan-binding domain-containing protein [Methylobacterium sp. 77]|uniref:peptidoglycan-binding domain-containing protein n=1 Tax=Methylobacterium sp. 77 TaxID=1101192 RepID=UPI0003686BC3|nr:peptidoglycan-binding domain-containing protein [Methylobacterium sp. 77]
MREPLPKRDQREIVVPARGAQSAPPRRKPASGPARRPSFGWLRTMGTAVAGFGRLCLRRPGEVLGSVVALGAVAAVAMNALGFQGGPHPAPIFPTLGKGTGNGAAAKPQAAKPAEPAKSAEPARLAEAPPRKIDVPKSDPGPEQKAALLPEPAKPATKPVVAAQATKRDVIAEIIKAGETTASVTPKTDVAVAQAQRALVKLGYGPLVADGVLGAGTRAAIEKFERDRKLPVKGVAAGRTLRELASSAGSPKG